MEAFGEANPIYLDEAAAAGRRPAGGVVAPPTMMAAFTTRNLAETRASDTWGQPGLRRAEA